MSWNASGIRISILSKDVVQETKAPAGLGMIGGRLMGIDHCSGKFWRRVITRE